MKRLFILINLVLLAGIAFCAVKIFYQVTTASLDRSLTPLTQNAPQITSKGENATAATVDTHAILARNLFHVDVDAAARPVSKSVDIGSLAQTRLDLRLWGTVAAPGDNAYAVIEDVKKKRQLLLRVNDRIEDATLKMILREKVILEVSGKDEVLEMERFRTLHRPMRTAFRGPETGIGEEHVRVPRQEIESAVKNVNQLMRQVRIRPHFTNGRADGLRLTGIRSGSIFSRMGLRSGDVLVGVDGERIQSVDDALKFYKSLKSGGSVKLQVRRGSREKTIDYRVE